MATLEEVRTRLEAAGYRINNEGRNKNDNATVLRTMEGAVVNVYDTGTCQVQGQGADDVKAALGELCAPAKGRARPASGGTPASAHTDVFVVYGRDTSARTQLEAMLRRWGLNPLILDQLPSEGATLIEKLERYQSSANFAVVLATPDDEGHIAGEPDRKRPRARQNVVLELGMMLAKLDRSRVAILLKNDATFEKPSDIDGLIYIPFDNGIDDTRVNLAKEMNKQGYRIDIANL